MNQVRADECFNKYRRYIVTSEERTEQLISTSKSGAEEWQTWTRGRRLGRGAYGQVWQETWKDENGDIQYRAVKEI